MSYTFAPYALPSRQVTHDLGMVQHALDVARRQIEVGVLLLAVDDHRQTVADHLRQRRVHRRRLDGLPLTEPQSPHLCATRIDDKQVLFLPLQRERRAQSQRTHYD